MKREGMEEENWERGSRDNKLRPLKIKSAAASHCSVSSFLNWALFSNWKGFMENAFLFKQIKKGLHTALKDMWVNESCWGDNLNGKGNDYYALEEQDFLEFDQEITLLIQQSLSMNLATKFQWWETASHKKGSQLIGMNNGRSSLGSWFVYIVARVAPSERFWLAEFGA